MVASLLKAGSRAFRRKPVARRVLVSACEFIRRHKHISAQKREPHSTNQGGLQKFEKGVEWETAARDFTLPLVYAHSRQAGGSARSSLSLQFTRQTTYLVTAFIVAFVFGGLAIYVVTRNPRRAISWIFAAFGFTVANHYVSSLFLYPLPGDPSPITPLALRWKWAVDALSPTLYLHFVTFYFPSAWQRHRSCLLGTAYLGSAGLALAALFTDLLVAGPVYRPPPHTIAPLPGPLMRVYGAFTALEIVIGVVGLVVNYRATLSPFSRHQTRQLLLSTGLIILSSVVNWVIVLTGDAERIPHELADASLIAAGCLYAQAVLQYGSLIGRPLNKRTMLYSALGGASLLLALYLGLALDGRLAAYLPFPLLGTISLLVLVVVVGYAPAKRWVTERLDRLLFHAHRQRPELVHSLAERLARISDPAQRQSEWLRVICEGLGLDSGIVAWSASGCAAESLTVQAIYGDLAVRVGDNVPPLLLRGREPVLAAGLPPQERLDPSWQAIALFCPLRLEPGRVGVLALGEKRDGRSFTPDDVTFCSEMVEQLGLIERVARLREAGEKDVEAIHKNQPAWPGLQEKSTAVEHQSTATPVPVPLEIHVLGSLCVLREGKSLREAEWGTEKAKSLLAYLLWKGASGATLDEIVTLLWPDHPLEKAANAFHVTLHRLRRALEPGLGHVRHSHYILHERKHYRFNFDAPHRLDVTAFQALSTSDDVAALREAVTLYQGPYLEDASLVLPAEVEIERQRLERLYANVLRRLLARLDEQQAGPFLERLLAVEPFNQAASRALVLSYMARGRGDLARRQVALWREAMAELGLEPSPETEALWHAMEEAESHRWGSVQDPLARTQWSAQDPLGTLM
jgi:DNA-binding SARP family transcriptional activator